MLRSTNLRLLFSLLISVFVLFGCKTNVENPISGISPSLNALDFIGEYECFGKESGLLAFAAEVSIEADGTIAVDWFGLRSPNSGTWSYEEGGQMLIFSHDIDFATGTYIPKTRSMRLMLKDGIQRAHAEEGELHCNQRSSQ